MRPFSYFFHLRKRKRETWERERERGRERGIGGKVNFWIIYEKGFVERLEHVVKKCTYYVQQEHIF